MRKKQPVGATPIARRALDAAETLLEAGGFRYESRQIPGLAHALIAFAENEIRLYREPLLQDLRARDNEIAGLYRRIQNLERSWSPIAESGAL